MVRNYPKIDRIYTLGNVEGKKFLSRSQIKELLDGEIVVEEKLDGKTIAREHGSMVVYGEWMKERHTIYYDLLPDWLIAFDVYDTETKRFVDYNAKIDFLSKHGYCAALLLYRGRVSSIDPLLPLLGRSAYSKDSLAEGIVVKNYRKQMFGKIIREDFISSMEEHWTRQKRTEDEKYNRLAITSQKPTFKVKMKKSS